MASLRLNINSNNKQSTLPSNLGPRMPDIRRVDLGKPQPTKPKKKIKLWKLVLIFIALALIAVGFWYFFINKDSSKGNPFSVKKISKEVKKVVIPDLKQDKNGYTNVLLVGKDTREWSKGLQNTDTVIVASYNDKTGEILLISIPRDTFIQYPNDPTHYGRINGVYANGIKRGDDSQGISMLQEVSEDVTGLEIQYWAIVDLAGFKKAIDIVGGVDIDVERSFTDTQFPEDGTGGYRTVQFEKGIQHMDGATALDYARSRKGCCKEGSDFARARRQQRVISAFLDKVIQMESLNLDTALKLKGSFDESVIYSKISVTDIRAALARITKVSTNKITSIVLDPSIQNGTLIFHPSLAESGGAYAIWPVAGLNKWGDVQKFIAGIITDPALYREGAKVYTYNGGLGYTETNGESGKVKKAFSQVTITYGGNNGAGDVTDVVILVTNEKPETLKRVKKYLEETLGYKVEVVREMADFTAKHSEDLSIIFGEKAPEETETAPPESSN
jgi:LCP family protein required for cell wall assembly